MADNFDETYLHDLAAGNDALYIKSIISNYTFMDVARVIGVSGDTLTCSVNGDIYTNVEILVLGVKGFGLRFKPIIGDVVLMLCPKHTYKNIKSMTIYSDNSKYDVSGMKCIPLVDSSVAQLITVSQEGIEITHTVASLNRNEFKMTKNGITFKDTNNNQFETTSKGIKCKDLSGNEVETTPAGVTFKDKYNNQAVTTTAGITITDKNNNKITTASSGVTVTDKSNNKIATASSGITLTSVKGSKIVMGTSVKINNHLEIK